MFRRLIPLSSFAAGAATVAVASSLSQQASTNAVLHAQQAALCSSGGSSSVGKGEISTHVISKLGKGSVDGAAVRVFYHQAFTAGAQSNGWTLYKEAKLSANGGVDDLVPPGEMKRGLYMLEFDFSGVDHAARQIFKRVEGTGADDMNAPGLGSFQALNPTGFFLAPRSCLTLKIEDDNSMNHLVLSVGDKELTARPGVRAH